jgi:hypothetical protein
MSDIKPDDQSDSARHKSCSVAHVYPDHAGYHAAPHKQVRAAPRKP